MEKVIVLKIKLKKKNKNLNILFSFFRFRFNFLLFQILIFSCLDFLYFFLKLTFFASEKTEGKRQAPFFKFKK